MTFPTSTPNHPLAPTGRSERQVRNVKLERARVRGFYIIMRAGMKGLIYLGCKKKKKKKKKKVFYT